MNNDMQIGLKKIACYKSNHAIRNINTKWFLLRNRSSFSVCFSTSGVESEPLLANTTPGRRFTLPHKTLE